MIFLWTLGVKLRLNVMTTELSPLFACQGGCYASRYKLKKKKKENKLSFGDAWLSQYDDMSFLFNMQDSIAI